MSICNPSTSVCDIENTFAAVAVPACSMILNPASMQGEQLIYDMAFRDLINSRGVPVNYYINTFNLSAADTLYGEEPLAEFYGPIPIMMYVELQEDAISFASYGIESDDSVTAYVHIDTFVDTMSGTDFNILTNDGAILTSYNIIDLLRYDKPHESNGQDLEPKAGDLIEIATLGCDRPGSRGAKIFELTEETDQDTSSINPMMGHYVWRLRGKRYEHSFERGAPGDITTRAPQEPGNDQIYDSNWSGVSGQPVPPSPLVTEDGRLTLTEAGDDYIQTEGGETYTSPSKDYGDDIEEKSKKIFDMSDVDVYGDYY